MKDLIEFLRAQLDADERAAQDPQALADTQAKRRIVDRCAFIYGDVLHGGDAEVLAEFVVTELAKLYRDRPGFNPRWLALPVAG